MNDRVTFEGNVLRPSKILGDFPAVVHVVTGRRFGNMSLRARRESESVDSIVDRRKTFETLLGPGCAGLVFMNQVHGDAVFVVGRENAGNGVREYMTSIAATDAMITREPGLALAVETADCVPILLYDPATNSIGVVHAGWRGTAARIAGNAIQAMVRAFGSDPAGIRAFLGPSIGPCCYEVGEEVLDRFISQESDGVDRSHSRLDLRRINERQLLASGLKAPNVEVSDICTSCRHDLFFSYRKESGKTGGFVSVIMIGNPT